MKKITLNKETVRRLDATDLKRANGGGENPCTNTVTIIIVVTGNCDTEVECITIRACPPETVGPPKTRRLC